MKKHALANGVVLLSLTLSFVTTAFSAVIDSGGGVVTSAAGAQLVIPTGALRTVTNVNLYDESLSDLGVTLPTGHGFAGAVTLDLGGTTLTADAVLTIPAGTSSSSPAPQLLLAPPDLGIPAEAPSPDRYIVSEVVDFGGSKHLSLKDTASVGFDGLVQTDSSAASDLPGIHSSGTYAFTTLPPGLGIVRVGVLSNGLPAQNADVTLVTTAVAAGTSASTINSAFSTEALFLSQTNSQGFAIIPGVISDSTITAVATAPGSIANLPLVGVNTFTVPILPPHIPTFLGKFGDLIQDKVSGGIPVYSTIPPCPCTVLAPNPSTIPPSIYPFVPGDSVNLKVACGTDDVTTSSGDFGDIADLITALVSGAEQHATFYQSKESSIAEVSTAGVITGVAAGQTKIQILNESVSMVDVNGVTLPQFCPAYGIVPVTVTARAPIPTPTPGGPTGSKTIDGVTYSWTPNPLTGCGAMTIWTTGGLYDWTYSYPFDQIICSSALQPPAYQCGDFLAQYTVPVPASCPPGYLTCIEFYPYAPGPYSSFLAVNGIYGLEFTVDCPG